MLQLNLQLFGGRGSGGGNNPGSSVERSRRETAMKLGIPQDTLGQLATYNFSDEGIQTALDREWITEDQAKKLGLSNPEPRVKVKGSSDLLRLMDKYGIEHVNYNYSTDEYTLSQKDIAKLEKSVGDKKYLKTVLKGSSLRTSSRASTTAGRR